MWTITDIFNLYLYTKQGAIVNNNLKTNGSFEFFIGEGGISLCNWIPIFFPHSMVYPQLSLCATREMCASECALPDLIKKTGEPKSGAILRNYFCRGPKAF